MKLALAMMLLLSTGCAHMTQTQRVALYCNPLSQGLNLVALTLGLGLAFFGGVEQMDRSAKFSRFSTVSVPSRTTRAHRLI